MKILLTGHGGSWNRGCEAIVRSTIDMISTHRPKSTFYLISDNPKSDHCALKGNYPNLKIYRSWLECHQRFTFPWIIKTFRKRILRGHAAYLTFLNNRHLYHSCDVMLMLGGDLLTDDYYGGPRGRFNELSYAKSLGAKTVIWGASIGPFKNSTLETQWSDALRRVDLITVREQKSLEYLSSIGVVKNVRLVADPAFLLATHGDTKISLSSVKSNRIVGIGMSALISKYGSNINEYLNVFTTFGNALLSDRNTQLLLIPHVFQNGNSNNDDQKVCQQLATRLSDNRRIVLIDRKYNACQTKHIIAQCDYFIGARAHSIIASLSSYVPSISISYSSKTYGINKDIFGHTDYVLSIRELNHTSLMERFNLLQSHRSEVIKKLRRRIPAFRRKAARGAQFLIEMWENK